MHFGIFNAVNFFETIAFQSFIPAVLQLYRGHQKMTPKAMIVNRMMIIPKMLKFLIVTFAVILMVKINMNVDRKIFALPNTSSYKYYHYL